MDFMDGNGSVVAVVVMMMLMLVLLLLVHWGTAIATAISVLVKSVVLLN